ncbi:hypothetical protein ALQ72_100244 [Pseudomonas syringae pv. maculicola]|uniref:Uncharacterized protein n=1 Tax=Pseudomonas syringae pv. maculicola TaxID=59511 RepID=A0A0N0G1X6_PSEYM|nr:Unknown protein sequence [Pseudomonas syringae pv. maculicola]RMM83381.1 hypothetical protein ALQ72_100244 [Pseudomonas syringae pv. maculicola]RMV26339.1 hypothetical protein ALP13_101790 [Pseudomonas syringae pv. maculicola]
MGQLRNTVTADDISVHYVTVADGTQNAIVLWYKKLFV